MSPKQAFSTPLIRPLLLAAGLLLLALIASAVSLAAGAHQTSLGEALGVLWADDGSNAAFSVRELRLPRALCAFGVGVALALSGALIQVVVRNPLGDPGLTGVSGGAAFGVALTLTLISPAPGAIVLGGILGGAIAASLTFSISGGGASGLAPFRVILAGIAVSVFFIAATSAIMVLSRSSMQTLYYWMVGGFINRGWPEFALFWPLASLSAIAALALSPVLRLLLFDDTTAGALGLNAGRWRLAIGSISVVLAALSVAVAGPLGFIGFVAPHLARLALGMSAPPMALWLVISGLTGGALVAWADTGSRLLFDGRVPAGVLITVIGGATFLIMARRGLADAR